MFLEFSSDSIILFLLMLSRVLSLVMTLPVFGSERVLPVIRVGLGASLALIAFLVFGPSVTSIPKGLAPLILAMIGEIFLGLAMGFTVRFAMEAVSFAGNMAGFQMGFALANVIDPQTGTQVSLVGNFLMLTASLIFLVSGLYQHFIEGIINSFMILAPGEAVLRAGGMDRFIQIGGEMFVNTVRVGAPWIIVLLLAKVGLGLMARTFPQMNVIFVAFPVTVALGLITLAMAAPFVVALIVTIFSGAEGHFWAVLRAAMPG